MSGVAHTVVTVSGGDQATRNLASIYVALVDPSLRKATQHQLMARARTEVLAKLPPELRTGVGEVAAISAGAASTAAIQYVVSGPDLETSSSARPSSGSPSIAIALPTSG